VQHPQCTGGQTPLQCWRGPTAAGQLLAAGAQLVSRVSGHAVALAGSATRAILNLCIALLGLYYLLVAGDGVAARLRRVLPVPDAMLARLRERFVAVTEAMLIGTFLTAALQGTLVGAAFAVVASRRRCSGGS
jgi:predicted PurR-regulated permease PerM